VAADLAAGRGGQSTESLLADNPARGNPAAAGGAGGLSPSPGSASTPWPAGTV